MPKGNQKKGWLFGLFLFLALLYNCVVPLGEGPDEAGHFAYLLFLAKEGRLPLQSSTASDVPGEGHQPPLAYLLLMPTVKWLPRSEQQVSLRANPHFVWQGGKEGSAFLRSSREYWPWEGYTLAWHLARFCTTLLGLLTLIGLWGIAKRFFGDENRAFLTVSLIAFQPQFIFTMALVTNDALLSTLSTILFGLCLAGEKEKITTYHYFRWAISLGIVFGLALLTKQSAFLLGPLVFWSIWHREKNPWRAKLLATLCWLGMTLLLAGWWYLRNWQLYGDPLGLATFQATFKTQPFAWASLTAWQEALTQLHSSFWAQFGWLSLPVPPEVSTFYTTLEIGALFGLLKYLPRLRKGENLKGCKFFPLFLLPLLNFLWLLSFVQTAGLVAWQGRFLFPALPALALLLAAGLWKLIPATFMRQKVLNLLLTLHFGLATLLPFTTIAPAYVWHTLPPTKAQTQLRQPIYARFAQAWEKGAELRGWKAQGDFTSGQTITLTLTWHVLEQMPQNWMVFVHLLDSKGQIIAQQNSFPQAGTFPTTLWAPGDWLEDSHSLLLPPTLPSGPFTLQVGLYRPRQQNPTQGKRQKVWDEQNKRLKDDVVTLGPFPN